ncbi:MAG: hypothetical protein VCE91_00315 [Nitrospinota bacterium]
MMNSPLGTRTIGAPSAPLISRGEGEAVSPSPAASAADRKTAV